MIVGLNVGSFLKLKVEMDASGRQLGDVYKVTRVSDTRVHYELHKGVNPRSGWQKGMMSPSSINFYWEILPDKPNREFM